MKRLILTRMNYHERCCNVSALWDNGKIRTLHLERDADRFLGSIHVGKVQKVLPDIGGAFIEVQDKVVCYLPLSKNRNPIYTMPKKGTELKAGDELIVQVTAEALKMKAPSVSCNLSFTGTYLVLTTENRRIGASGKLSRFMGDALKEFIKQELPEDRSYGVVLRTNCKDATKEQILRELHILQNKMETVLKKGAFSPARTMILPGESPVAAQLKNMYWDSMEKIVTDDPGIYADVTACLEDLYEKAPCPVHLYQDDLLPLYKLYSLEQAMDDAFSKKVWLRSGGFLIIEPTEAFVSIDVNTGKKAGKKPDDEMFFKINKEAAEEIARQMSLRNMYGMILVDFINMKEKEYEQQLISYMNHCLKGDRVKTTVVDITPLGIMEITRKKEEKSLLEQYCAIEKSF